MSRDTYQDQQDLRELQMQRAMAVLASSMSTTASVSVEAIIARAEVLLEWILTGETE